MTDIRIKSMICGFGWTNLPALSTAPEEKPTKEKRISKMKEMASMS